MYNAYGYNPYMNQGRFQNPVTPQVQPVQPIQTGQQMYSIPGKQVDSMDVVKAMDIPLDGSVCYFPLADETAIVTKKLQMNGTSKITIYKPVVEESPQEVTYATMSDVEKAINNIDFSDIDNLKKDVQNIKSTLDDLKKKKKE